MCGAYIHQFGFYINNLNEEDIAEFHCSYLQHDGTSTYEWYYYDDRVRFVGPTMMMPIVG